MQQYFTYLFIKVLINLIFIFMIHLSCGSYMRRISKTLLEVVGASLLFIFAAGNTAQGAAPTTSTVSSQQRGNVVISGKVVDVNGEPLIGVSVLERGTNAGVTTNVNGAFTITVKQGATLQFSYVGFNTLNLKAAKGMKVTMQEDVKALDELVIVGYGSTTKRNLISSVSQVKSKELTDLPITNITQGLAGRSPGLIVQGAGGGINKQSTISIRGGGTPLIVIDGVIRDYSDFVALDPNDIESMSILKDASATAVYGSRATNGIMQVVTKKGKAGRPVIEYSLNQSWSQPVIMPEKLSSYQIAKYRNEALANDGLTAAYSEDDLKMYQDGSDPQNHPNTNWKKLVLRNFAPQTKHNVSMTGGNETHQYYASLGYVDQNSLFKSDTHWMKRTNFKLAETAIWKETGLKIDVGIDGYTQHTRTPYDHTGYGNYWYIFSHVINRSPMGNGLNKYGQVLGAADNPIAETSKDAGYHNDRTSEVAGTGNVVWNLPWVKGLDVRATGNYRFYQDDNKYWQKDADSHDWDSKEPISGGLPSLSQSMSTSRTWTLQYFAEYNNKFGLHNISALGGYEMSYNYGHSMGLSRDSYVFNVDQISAGPATTMQNSGSEWESGRAGWIGQVKYNYAERYFAEGSVRYDGSDNFRKGHRWGTFYSGALGWLASDEAFMKTLKEKNIINMLKIRTSYGEVGLDNWSSPYSISRYSYLASYNLNGTGYVANGVYVPTFTEGSLPSTEITWFTTKQFDAGFDFTSLNDRLYGMFDYFYYQTKGFLYAPDQLKVGYTDPLGTSLAKVKTDGQHRRAGFEVQIGWRDNFGDLKYDVSFNYTHFDQLWARNPVESLAAKKNPYQRTTQQTGYYDVMYKCLGFFKDADDVKNSAKPLNSSNLTAGDLKYYDYNGDGVITDADKMRRGKSSFPRGNYGLNINLSYKGISFSTLFQGATSFDMYLGDTYAMQSSQTFTSPFFKFQRDYWTPTNTDAKFPRLVSSNGINNNNNTLYSDFWLINGAYFRMKDIRIAYDLKYKLLKNVNWLSKCVVGFSGQNIFTISKATRLRSRPRKQFHNWIRLSKRESICI
jgi:TonB-linked SusC/RagA family outer membrane protein